MTLKSSQVCVGRGDAQDESAGNGGGRDEEVGDFIANDGRVVISVGNGDSDVARGGEGHKGRGVGGHDVKLVGVAPLSVQLCRGGDRDLPGGGIDGEWDTSGSVESIPAEMRDIENSDRTLPKWFTAVRWKVLNHSTCNRMELSFPPGRL